MRSGFLQGIGLALAMIVTVPAASAQAVGMVGPGGSKITVEPLGPQQDEVVSGLKLIATGKPADAEKLFTSIIARFEASHDPAVPYRCTYDGDKAKRTIELSAPGMNGKKYTLGGYVWCAALFGKGFALIDLRRPDDAGPFLARAVEMAPADAHYVNEYAEWFKSRRQWQQSYDLFAHAWDIVEHDKQGTDRKIAARALRGMAYNKVEMGELDEAEKLYNRSLEFEPEHGGVRGELDYIAGLKARRGKN